jgi:hypothetical protein
MRSLVDKLSTMQFAVPPRKGFSPAPYARTSFLTFQRRKQLKTIIILSVTFLAVFFLLSHPFYPSIRTAAGPVGSPGVVIVTLLDRAMYSDTYLQKIIKNREDYAQRHGTWQLQGYIFQFSKDLSRRLHKHLRQCIRLQFIHRQLPAKLGYSPRSPTCNGIASFRNVLLPPRRACAIHELKRVA